MIKVENVEVCGFEHATRGMRNPMDSWCKSDSGLGCTCRKKFRGKVYGKWLCRTCEATYDENHICTGERQFVVGDDDLALMKKLVKAGPEHRKFLRQIFISMDITAPLYWWKEFDTYKVGTTANSCSTMHRIHAKEFTLDDFSHEHLMEYALEALRMTIDRLNEFRNSYQATKDKDYWWQMIQLLPSSYNQRRTVTMTYENALNMIAQRENHKQDEWREGLVPELLKLPYMTEFANYRKGD